mgnify:CR=1 FL=1
MAGAGTGGGLTLFPEAPNPPGLSKPRGPCAGGAISPLWLFAAASLPTLVAILAFRAL